MLSVSIEFAKEYQMYCGVIYLPNEMKMPFRGPFGSEWSLQFPIKPGDELELVGGEHTVVLEYGLFTIDQFESIFKKNYEHFMLPLYDKEYGLDLMRKDW